MDLEQERVVGFQEIAERVNVLALLIFFLFFEIDLSTTDETL